MYEGEYASNNEDRFKPRFLRSFLSLYGPNKLDDLIGEDLEDEE
jgi:hypothetical protein